MPGEYAICNVSADPTEVCNYASPAATEQHQSHHPLAPNAVSN